MMKKISAVFGTCYHVYCRSMLKPQSQLPKESRSTLYQSNGEQQTASKDSYSTINETLGIIMEYRIKRNHCFKKSNISQSNQQAAVNGDDSFKCL